MSSLLNQDIKNRIAKIEINRGSNFDLGSPTSLLQMVGNAQLNDLSQIAGDITYTVASESGSLAGDAAALTLARGGETVSNIVNIANATASAIESVDTLKNLIQSGEVVSLASDLALQLSNDVASYIGTKLGEASGKILALPTASDILGKAANQMKDHIRSASDILKSMLTNTEDEQKQSQDNALKNRVADIKNKATSKLGEITKTLNNYAKEVGKWSEEITAYIVEGPDWVEEKMQMYENIAFAYISNYVDQGVKFITDYKEETVNTLADAIAKKEADLYNKTLEKKTKKTLDEINQSKQKILNKAKSKVGAALLKLYATLGL